MTIALDRYKVASILQIVSMLTLVAVMPYYPSPAQRIIMASAVIFFLLDYAVNRRWMDWTWSRDKWLYVAMIAYYLLIPLWHIGSESTNWVLTYVLERQMPLAVCGLVGFAGFSRDFKLRYVAYVMIASAVIASLYIIWRADGFQFFSTHRAQVDTFAASRIAWVSDHMCFNLYLNVTLVFAFYLITDSREPSYTRIAATVASLWIFYILSISDGRVGFATGIVVFGIMLCTLIYRHGGWRYLIPVAALSVVAAGVLLTHHHRLSDENLEDEPRQYLWAAGVEVIKDSPIVGHGVCDSRELFMEHVRADRHLDHYRATLRATRNGDEMRAHPHSAYLESLADFGIIGLLLLLFILIYPVVVCPQSTRLLVLLVVGIFMIQLTFDKFLSPLLYSLAVIFLIQGAKRDTEPMP